MAPSKTAATAPISVRLLWTWDHATEWNLNRPGAQTIGACNPYFRSTDDFVADYTRLLRWCGRNGIDGVVVWGLLRDVHGGVEAARRLCEVAAQAGVRLLAGVGLNAYGGVYYDGASPYSLTRRLEQHPELYGLDPQGRPMRNVFGSHHVACPSRRENQDFAAESLQWLLREVPLGGVQIEAGDTGVCQCAQCRDRRRFPAGVFSWEDMALMYPPAAKAVWDVAPDAWVVCETYSHLEPFAGPAEAPYFGEGKPTWADACLKQFPQDVFVQWVADRYVPPHSTYPWTAAGRVPASGHRHLMRGHFSTYWFGLRGELAVPWIAEMARRSMNAGCCGTSVFGEASPFAPTVELNYLALADLGSTANPQADLDSFLDRVAAPRLGGPELARRFAEFAGRVRAPAGIPEAIEAAYATVGQLQRQPAAARRWTWLANYLASFLDSPEW
jgi:hypothetical protein